MNNKIQIRSYRKALRLAAACDSNLLMKSMLTPPAPATPSISQPPPIPLVASIRELVRGGFRTPLPAPTSEGKWRNRANGQCTTSSKDVTATAFFALRWLQQAVTLGTELSSHLPASPRGQDHPSGHPFPIETVSLPAHQPLAPPLCACSVLYTHPSVFQDQQYRGVFVSVDGWRSAPGPIAGKVKRRQAKYPIIQLNNPCNSLASDLFSSPSKMLSFDAVPSRASRGHLNVIGRLPVYLGGPHRGGPYLVHSHHTVAYLIAARKGPFSSSTAVARPFYVSLLSEILALPLKVVCTLTPSNCRVVVNHYDSQQDLGRGAYLHESKGLSVPEALIGPATRREPFSARSLPRSNSEWGAGLSACGLHSLSRSSILSPAQRAAIRDGRNEIWETNVALPVPSTKRKCARSSVGSTQAQTLQVRN